MTATANYHRPAVLGVHSLVANIRGERFLRDITFELGAGEHLALIGPPASGKTLLAKALCGLHPVEQGSHVQALGMPRPMSMGLSDGPEQGAWYRHFGMAFQNDALLDDRTVFENVAFPLRVRAAVEAKIEQAVMAALTNVGLAEAREKMPHDLSGGMRKRVGIARALIHNPPIAIFDEPTAGLDPESAQRILALITQRPQSDAMATITISHDLPVVLPICDKVMMLWAGEIIYFGDVAGLSRSEYPNVRAFISVPAS